MTHTAGIRVIVVAALCALGQVTEAAAGGIPPFDSADRELFCTLLAESHQGTDEWAPVQQGYDFSDADQVLIDVDTQICLARFEEALAIARLGHPELETLPQDWRGDRRRARLEVLAGTAQLALGYEHLAREHFGAALALDPNLQLDVDATSPKVRRVFDDVRERSLARR